MAQGASTPIEIRVSGKNFEELKTYAGKLVHKLEQIDYLRDVAIAQPLSFPTLKVHIDRLRLAQMGLNLNEVARSITDATSSSRFTEKVQWLDEKVSYTYQVQVQVPEYLMNSMEQLQSIPLVKGSARPVLSDLAQITLDSLPGEYDRAGPRRFLTVRANIFKKDLGTATSDSSKCSSLPGRAATGIGS